MPTSKPRRRRGKGETIPPLMRPERIDELLRVQVETFPNKVLSAEEIGRWQADLEPYLMEAVEWAFDNWRRNGHFFPVPGDIIDQCDAWTPAIQQGLCAPECKARHGKGLWENDIVWLWKAFSKKRAEVDRALTEDEKQEVLAALDVFRGGPPEYRL